MRVELADQAARTYRKLELAERRQVAAVLDALAHNPRPTGKRVKAIVGQRDRFLRYRVGDLRLMYEIHDDEQVVLVLAIIRRRDLQGWLRRQR